MLDVVGRVPEQPGQQDLPLGQRHVGPDPPLVLVPRVGHLEGVGARVDPQHDRHHVGQRDVVQPGPVVEPVAGVQPDPVLGDAAQRVVERLDVLPRPAAALGLVAAAVVGEDLDQPRVVHLQQEARLDDGQVLLAHGLGHRGQVVLLGGVVVVAAEAAGAGGGEEGLDRARSLGQRGAEVGDVGLDRVQADVGQPRSTSTCRSGSTRGSRRSPAARTAAAASRPPPGRTRPAAP